MALHGGLGNEVVQECRHVRARHSVLLARRHIANLGKREMNCDKVNIKNSFRGFKLERKKLASHVP